MSDWFRGSIEGAYVGTPSQETDKLPSDATPFEIRLYRASISAIERIAPPDDELVTTASRDGAHSADASNGGERSASESEPSDLAEVTDAGATPAAVPRPTRRQEPQTLPDVNDSSEQDVNPQTASVLPGPTTVATGAESQREFRQAELLDVRFLGVGSADATDHHAAFDLRITDVCLLGATEVDGKIYGRLTGTVIGSLAPSTSMMRQAAAERRRRRQQSSRVGAWVEALRWVMIGLVGFLAFGLCGVTLGLLWLVVVLPAAFLRFLTAGAITPSHGVRVFGWAMVFATACLGALLYYRVLTAQCDGVLWWLAGMVLAIFVSCLLPSRYPFFWTKTALAATTLSLCVAGGAMCRDSGDLPSVVSQGPRTDADGRWPREPEAAEVAPATLESREFARPLSLHQAVELGDELWASAQTNVVVMATAELLGDGGQVLETPQAAALLQLLKRHADRHLLLEVHTNERMIQPHVTALAAWLKRSGAPPTIEVRAAGSSFPIVPTDSPAQPLNDRIELWVSLR